MKSFANIRQDILLDTQYPSIRSGVHMPIQLASSDLRRQMVGLLEVASVMVKLCIRKVLYEL